MSVIDVKVPDIGDYKDVPVIEVHVKPGDRLKPEDPIVTLESDKAAMEVPASHQGSARPPTKKSSMLPDARRLR